MKKERGCTEKGIVPFYINEEKYFRCPLRLVTDTTWEYIEAYGYYKKNLLPNGLNYMNESQKYLSAMRLLDNEYANIEQEQIKKIKNKSHAQ